MIWESGYWKMELLRIARRLQSNMTQKRWTMQSDALLEKNVFVAAYAVRKLLEAHKLSQQMVERRMPVMRYSLRAGKRITHMNWHRIDELYDLTSPALSDMSVMSLCNQFIHSYVFLPMFDDAGSLSDLAVSSDRDRNRRLLSVSVEELVTLLVDIATDDVIEARYIWDDRVGDYIVINSGIHFD